MLKMFLVSDAVPPTVVRLDLGPYPVGRRLLLQAPQGPHPRLGAGRRCPRQVLRGQERLRVSVLVARIKGCSRGSKTAWTEGLCAMGRRMTATSCRCAFWRGRGRWRERPREWRSASWAVGTEIGDTISAEPVSSDTFSTTYSSPPQCHGVLENSAEDLQAADAPARSGTSHCNVRPTRHNTQPPPPPRTSTPTTTFPTFISFLPHIR